MRSVLAVAGVLSFCALPPAAAQGLLDEAEAVLLQTYLDRTPLGDGLEVFPAGDGALVPLGELCRLLAFGIRVDAPSGVAEGFFIEEKRRFRLDLPAGVVEVDGRRQTFPAHQIRRGARELFVDTRLLIAWFPIGFEVDFKGAALLLSAREKLPIQETWERENRFGNEGMRRYGDDPMGATGRWQPTPYHAFDLPFADISVAASQNSDQTMSSVQGSASLAGDLLWMSSSFYINRDQDGRWGDGRATLFREDPRGGMFGPLHARNVVLGDLLNPPSMDLIGGLPQGRGLSLDNFPVAYRTHFATRTFRGSLPDGWSVEFFQNGGLVGFQNSRFDGLYEFSEVPLRFGINEFRLVFHGPQGQLREESSRLDITQDQPAPGSFLYSLAYVKPRTEDRFAVGYDGDATELSRPASMVQAEYGLTSSFALRGGASRVELQDGAHTFGMFGMRSAWPYLALQVSLAQEQSEGRKPGLAAEAVARTGFGNASLMFRRAEFRRNFQSPLSGGDGFGSTDLVLRSSNEVELSDTLKLGSRHISLTLAAESERFVDGRKGWSGRGTVSTQFAGLNVANSLSRVQSPDVASQAPLEGNFALSSFWRDFSLQVDVDYQRDQGRMEVTGWGTQGEYHPQDGLTYTAGLQVNSTEGNDTTQVLAGVSKLLGRFAIGLDYQGSKENYSLTLRLQLALGREPRTGIWTSDARSMTNQGALSAAAFLDANGNGLKDEGEALIEGASFKVGGTTQPSRIQDGRIAFLTQLPKGQEADISLDEVSLEDPAQKSMVKAYRIVPRPGKVAQLNFPVSTFGEVTGTTRIRRGKVTEELPGLEVEILKATGERVKVIRSAYDGFFEFRDLPYGEYVLRVTPDEVARMKVRVPEPRQCSLEGTRNFLDGQDLVIESGQETAREVQPVSPDPAPPSLRPTPVPAKPLVPTPEGVMPPPTKTDREPAPKPVSRTPSGSQARSVPQETWTIILVYAFSDDTIARAQEALVERAADLFVEPLPRTEGGKQLRRVCFGRFSSAGAAQKALGSLPKYFFLEGNHPRVFRLDSLPSERGLP